MRVFQFTSDEEYDEAENGKELNILLVEDPLLEVASSYHIRPNKKIKHDDECITLASAQ